MAARQIFYTIENEYSPDRSPPESGEVLRSQDSQAISDKLYVSPALDTASWCNETGYTVYLYVHTGQVRGDQEMLSLQCFLINLFDIHNAISWLHPCLLVCLIS